MAAKKPTRDATRIHGEIQELGLEIPERALPRSTPRRPAHPDERQRSRTSLANHREVIAAMGFFTVRTITFRVLYIFFVVHHTRRALIHVRATGHPTSASIAQQLREAFLHDQAPRYLVLDRDAKHGDDRTHSSLKKEAPAVRAVESEPHPAAEVIGLPRPGGPLHCCAWRGAA
jgi:hypothetical protein